MPYRLTDRLAYCIAGRRVILLDKDRGRYFGLGPDAEAAFVELLNGTGSLSAQGEQSLRGLVDQGYLLPAAESGPFARQATIEPATSDLAMVGATPVKARDIAFAVGWQFITAGQLAMRPLFHLLDRLDGRAISEPPGFEDVQQAILPISGAFAGSGLYLGYTDRCLVRSIAMFRVCRSRGVAAKLVIGVRSDPFVAHCWVQYAAVVLNDTTEHVRTFTPILVLG